MIQNPGKSRQWFPHGPMADELGFHLLRAQLAAFKHFAHAVGAVEGITPGLYGMLPGDRQQPQAEPKRTGGRDGCRPLLDRQGRRSAGGERLDRP